MDTIYVPLDDSHSDGAEIQVGTDRDQETCVTLDYKDIEGDTIPLGDGLILSPGEAEKLAEALTLAAAFARTENGMA